METEHHVVALIRGSFPASARPITPATPLREIVRDSIDAVELIAVLSDEFAIRIDPVALTGVRTVADLAAYVERCPSTADAPASLDTF